MTTVATVISGNISIHSLRMEGDIQIMSYWKCTMYFNPLPPHGGRPTAFCVNAVTSTFQSTPSAWRETRVDSFGQSLIFISIHSLRMEGDAINRPYRSWKRYFNPLPPHGGRRNIGVEIPMTGSFQSTPSAWRETHRATHLLTTENYFNPLPPHGGRHYVVYLSWCHLLFQSTPSAWRETVSEFYQ